MYTLTFKGYFEVDYPDEFLADLEELKKKHDVYFFGRTVMQDMGHYVDFQKEESSDVTVESDTKDTSDQKTQNEKNEEV